MTSPGLSPEHVFDVSVNWHGPGEHPTTEVRRFRRASVASSGTEVPEMRVSAARTFFGDRDAWNPETLLLAALAQCHLSAFLREAGLAGVSVEDASVAARAWLRVDSSGVGRISRAELRPSTVLERPAAAASRPDGLAPEAASAHLQELHELAHQKCFIANSVNFPVDVVPEA